MQQGEQKPASPAARPQEADNEAKKLAAVEAPSLFGMPLKYLSLLLLLVQNTATVLTMRYSRKQQLAYLASTAVVMMEVFKIGFSFVMMVNQTGLREALASVRRELQTVRQVLQLMVLPCLYAVQNNLLIAALTNLNASTYQVTYQLKVFTTVIFSVIILRKSFTPRQLFSVFLLFFGVVIVQLSTSAPSPAAAAAAAAATNGTAIQLRSVGDGIAATPAPAPSAAGRSATVGFVCVVLASLTSGFGSVFQEMLLKSAKSIWVQNFNFGIIGMVFGLALAFAQDGAAIMEGGFFQNYNGMTWIVIFLQAVGGLTVAAVSKYADNILKNFATSVSIVLGSVCAFVLFDERFGPQWIVGASTVVFSVTLYNLPARPRPQAPPQQV